MASPSGPVSLTRLREERQAAGLKQSELAEAAGCHQTMVALLESGARKARMPLVMCLAAALDLKVTDLIGASP